MEKFIERWRAALEFASNCDINRHTAVRNSYQKSFYKPDIPVGAVPMLIVTILRHVHDVSLFVSFHSGQVCSIPPAVSIVQVRENPKRKYHCRYFARGSIRFPLFCELDEKPNEKTMNYRLGLLEELSFLSVADDRFL